MKRLILLRHAKSDWLIGARSDHDRPLNAKGEKDAPLVGAYLAQMALVPDTIISSDSKRTRQTVEGISSQWTQSPNIVWTHDLYHASESTLLTAASNAPANCHTLMLVAHNPGIHALAANLLAPSSVDTSARFLQTNYPTAAMTAFRFEIEDWRHVAFHTATLECYQTPKMIKKNQKETS